LKRKAKGDSKRKTGEKRGDVPSLHRPRRIGGKMIPWGENTEGLCQVQVSMGKGGVHLERRRSPPKSGERGEKKTKAKREKETSPY